MHPCSSQNSHCITGLSLCSYRKGPKQGCSPSSPCMIKAYWTGVSAQAVPKHFKAVFYFYFCHFVFEKPFISRSIPITTEPEKATNLHHELLLETIRSCNKTFICLNISGPCPKVTFNGTALLILIQTRP